MVQVIGSDKRVVSGEGFGKRAMIFELKRKMGWLVEGATEIIIIT